MNNYNNRTQRWQGNVRPVYSEPTKPLWQAKTALGNSGQFFTAVTVRLLPSTVEYPEPAITIQMANGGGKCFVKINTLDELADLANFLNNSMKEVGALWITAHSRDTAITSAQDAMLKLLQQQGIDVSAVKAAMEAQNHGEGG